jgi:hypothetical protein
VRPVYLFIGSHLIFPPFLFVSPVDICNAGKVSTFVESDRGSITKLPSTTEHKGELVSRERVFANALSSTSSSVPQPLSRPSPVSAFDTVTVHPSQASTFTMSTFSRTQHSSYSAYSNRGTVTSPLQPSREINSPSESQPDSPYHCTSPTPPYSLSFITSANAPSSSRINGNDSSGAQVTEGEPRMVEHETERRRLRPFACGIDNCRRRYRSLKRLHASLPSSRSHPHLLILSVCRTSLSAFG